MSCSAPWKIADVIDFEVLLASRESADDAALDEKLRAEIARDLQPSRLAVFKKWLKAQRAQNPGALPGAHITAGWQTLLTVAALAGFILGGSVTGALLHYRGDEPVNVSWFLTCTIGVQMLFLAGAALFWLASRLTPFENFHPLRALLMGCVWLFSAGLQHLPGEQRERYRAAFALFTRQRDIYGPLSVWPLVIVTQLFAVSYNVGILAILFAHVAATDLAFGWQSTLNTSPEAAYRLVSALAAPWAWFAPQPHPSLEQIIASRFQYSTGLKPLSQSAMAAWWPFLCYAVVCYGLLLRGVLLTYAWAKGRAGLRGLRFEHQSCNALFRRLTGPIIRADENAKQLSIPDAPGASTTHAASGGKAFALIASDLALPADQPGTLVREAFGFTLAGTQTAQIDHPSGNGEVLAKLATVANELVAIVVFVRIKRAPIKAIGLFLQKVSAAAGGRAEVILLLCGPGADEDCQHWRNFVSIHHLPVSLERWKQP